MSVTKPKRLPPAPWMHRESFTGLDNVKAYWQRDRQNNETNFVVYYRYKRGGKVSLSPLEWEDGEAPFMVRYAAAKLAAAEKNSTPVSPGVKPHTFKWLCERFMKDREFTKNDAQTQRTRRGIYESMYREPIREGSSDTFADCPISAMTPHNIRVLMKRKGDLLNAANTRLKALRRAFKWAVECELIDSNPTRDVSGFKVKSEGHKKWREEDIEKYRARWPIGSKERLAFELYRYLGVRRGDVVHLGRQLVRNGVLAFTTEKTGEMLELPIPDDLQPIIAASVPPDQMLFLLTEYGKPFSKKGFGNWFRERCDEAGVPDRSAHGLRKYAATALAEAGATAYQLMAWFGWKSLAEAERHVQAANKKRLAASVVR